MKKIKILKILGVSSALLSILFAILLPFLPVKQTSNVIDWPSRAIYPQATTASVNSPLAIQTAKDFTVEIPATLINKLPDKTGVLLSTIPTNTKDARNLGFFATVNNNYLTLSFRGSVAASTEISNLTEKTNIKAWSNRHQVGATFTNVKSNDFPQYEISLAKQPQIAGIFTDLDKNTVLNSANTGLKVTITTDGRFQNTPTFWKYGAIIISLLGLLIALFAQAKIYRLVNPAKTEKPKLKNILKEKLKLVDLTVYALLVVWYFLAGNSPDDGYIRTMAQTAHQNGYLANYYRYYASPEAPFGWYYQLIAGLTHFSATSLWLRLPNLIVGILTWSFISIVLKKILNRTNTLNLSLWTAASVMLAFWFPMDSGLRSEAVIALGVVSAWYFIEKYIAKKNLLYFSLALIISILTVLTSPQGIIVLAVLISCSRAIFATIKSNLQTSKVLEISPLQFLLILFSTLSLGLVLVYSEQTFASINEAIRIRYAVGPVLNWSDEYMQYYIAFTNGIDGSLVYRLPILLMFAIGLTIAVYLLWVKKIKNVSNAVLWRALGILPVGMLLHLFTPVKWVIQFGIFASITAVLAGISVAMLDRITSKSVRNLAVIITGFALMLAITMAGQNSWYWVWNYGISWNDRKPVIHGYNINTMFVVIAGIGALIAAWLYVRDGIIPPEKQNSKLSKLLQKLGKKIPNLIKTTLRVSPIMIVAAILVMCELLVFTKAAYQRRNSYSVLKDDISVLKHQSCSMAEQVLVEQNTNDSFLQPLDKTQNVVTAFTGDSPAGFSPSGFTTTLIPYEEYLEHNQIHTVTPFVDPYYFRDAYTGTKGGLGPVTINGSRIKLPFGLDPKKVPFLGTYHATLPIEMHTGWYKLPPRNPNQPLLIVSAAGNIASNSKYGEFHYGQVLQIEYGKRDANGVMQLVDHIIPIDPGPQIAWRDLRIPMDMIPPDAEAVRILARDQILGDKQWLGFIPPRIPTLIPLQDMVGKTDPTLLDLTVAAQFPCQNPINFHNGIWQIPKWRITPNRQGTFTVSKTWADNQDGGPLAVEDTLLTAEVVPSYLRNDWYTLWGTLQRYSLNTLALPAETTTSTQTRSGWWHDGTIPKAN